jgi:hypothetical protein
MMGMALSCYDCNEYCYAHNPREEPEPVKGRFWIYLRSFLPPFVPDFRLPLVHLWMVRWFLPICHDRARPRVLWRRNA